MTVMSVCIVRAAKKNPHWTPALKRVLLLLADNNHIVYIIILILYYTVLSFVGTMSVLIRDILCTLQPTTCLLLLE